MGTDCLSIRRQDVRDLYDDLSEIGIRHNDIRTPNILHHVSSPDPAS